MLTWPMAWQVLGERLHRLVIPPLGGKEQALLLQVVHDGDVLMAFAQAGLVDADVAHAAHVVLLARDFDVVLDAPPQGLGVGPQMSSCMGHRQLLAQAQCQRFKQQREAAALARPGHGYLAGLATGAAGHAGHAGVQPGLELEEVQVAPGALDALVDALVGGCAVRAGHAPLGADHIEVDASLGCAELGAFHTPGRLQSKGHGKQGFGAQIHGLARWMSLGFTCRGAEGQVPCKTALSPSFWLAGTSPVRLRTFKPRRNWRAN